MKIHKTLLLNKILGPFGFQIKKGDFFLRPSTRAMKSLNKKNLICVEIGTYKGGNALNILKNLNIQKIYLIDPYVAYVNRKIEKNVGDKTFTEAKKRLKRFKHKIEFVREFSEKATKRFKNNSIDFIYIDGNHDYGFVKKDLELYFPKVKKGGIISGHDMDWKSVFKAVSEFCVKHKLECEIKEKDWIIFKK